MPTQKSKASSEHSVGIDALISHRFRGFSEYENTLGGLRAALDFGVQNLEFDVRVAKCGTPMIYHDEYALDGAGTKRLLCDYKASSYAKLGGAFARMPTVDALFSTLKVHKNQSAKLLIDIKDLGFEREIHALVKYYRLDDRAIYVSWIPEVLYRLNELAPDMPLCLSHWCGDVSEDVAARHEMHLSTDGHIPRLKADYMMGVRYGWVSKQGLRGDMLDILKASHGGICVPQKMLSADLRAYYESHNIWTSTFSYTDWQTIRADRTRLGIDKFFIDNKQVFDAL